MTKSDNATNQPIIPALASEAELLHHHYAQRFGYAAFAMRIIEGLLRSRFTVSGVERLPKQPIMYAANHFTRSETFFVPYIINKYVRRKVRCLADASLFYGVLGRFLKSIGTVSTNDPNRDKIIVADLISGDGDWMIYPEGAMVKSKEIKRGSGFITYTPHRVGATRTGSVVLALKSELYRKEIIKAYEQKDEAVLAAIESQTGVKYVDRLKTLTTCVVPLNITYYPIRPGNNSLEGLIGRLVKNIPANVAEEIEIESNLLLNSEIHIAFGEPMNLKDQTEVVQNIVTQIPLLSNETKTNLAIRYFKHRLTYACMEEVYRNTQINFDHIFSAVLYYFPHDRIEIDQLKRIIYLSAVMIERCGKYPAASYSIAESNVIKIFWDEPNEAFDGVFKLATNLGLIESISEDVVEIDKEMFEKKYDFHRIRIENTLQVIFNEFALLTAASDIVKNNCELDDEQLRQKVFDSIFEADCKNFKADYESYFDPKFSKPESVGSPFFLESRSVASSKIKKTGILISHGYKSAPMEIEGLAKFLNGFGFKVYGVRLKGHGTAPINLSKVGFEDWYESMQRGYAALRNISSRVIIVGFSTGGLLSLLSAARKDIVGKMKISAVVSINAALKLRDIRARMVKGVTLWNEMLQKLRIGKARFEYVDDVPENPNINYSRNYIKGVRELERLMKECKENLAKIASRVLIIQAKNDPVVDPASGGLIYQKIKSPVKTLVEPDFSNHVIITGNRKEEVFEIVINQLQKMNVI